MSEPPTPRDETTDAEPRRVREALGVVPYVLVAMAGACTLSGGLGFAWIVTGHEAPPTTLLLLPPGVVVAAIPVLLLRRGAGGAG